ncbi:MAG: DUF6933 domain-containing protein [Chitinophagaceae bacterium]
MIINRKKCIIWTNKATLYSIFRLNVLKKNFTNPTEMFLNALFAQLKYDGLFSTSHGKYWYDNAPKLIYAKTDNDKKVIGSMNDFMRHIEVGIKFGSSMLVQLNDNTLATYINTIPMGLIDNKIPLNKFRESFANI